MTEEKECVPAPDCCDMRGMLSFRILYLLSKRDMYGQELAEELTKKKGDKLSPGTIYPALKDMVEKGLIKYRNEGRRKIYSITELGIEGFDSASAYFRQEFSEILSESGSGGA